MRHLIGGNAISPLAASGWRASVLGIADGDTLTVRFEAQVEGYVGVTMLPERSRPAE